MFSKPIFKQTLKSNYILWLIFTGALSVLGALFIAVYDVSTFSSMTDMIGDLAVADMLGDRLDNMTSLLGILGTTFYEMLCVMLPLIYVIIVANNLVASQVDRGSMAYLLSTPIKRSKVVATQAIFMVGSLFCMFAVVAGVGLCATQLVHGGVVGETYTSDVKEVASELDMERDEVLADLNIILEDEDALAIGAEARDIDEDVYEIYVGLKITEHAYEAAAEVLEVEAEEVSADPALLLEDEKAIEAAAEVMDMEADVYEMYLQNVLEQEALMADESAELQNQMLTGITAAAEEMDMELEELTEDLGLLKEDDDAMEIAVTTSGIPEETFVTMINQALASNELSVDAGVDFEVKDFLLMNVGIFLLLFATSSISFLASCIFNLSKNSLALGAGIPVAFFIFDVMGKTSDSMEAFKYFSLNTLYDSSAIISGSGYGVQFAVLGVMGVVLYVAGMIWFTKKDLPL